MKASLVGGGQVSVMKYPFLARHIKDDKIVLLVTSEGSNTSYCGVRLPDGDYSVHWEKRQFVTLPVGTEFLLVQE